MQEEASVDEEQSCRHLGARSPPLFHAGNLRADAVRFDRTGESHAARIALWAGEGGMKRDGRESIGHGAWREGMTADYKGGLVRCNAVVSALTWKRKRIKHTKTNAATGLCVPRKGW